LIETRSEDTREQLLNQKAGADWLLMKRDKGAHAQKTLPEHALRCCFPSESLETVY
jgi:hypothetical protein